MTTHNQEELKKAEEAFGDKLAELRKNFPNSRLIKSGSDYGLHIHTFLNQTSLEENYYLMPSGELRRLTFGFDFLEEPKESEPLTKEQLLAKVPRLEDCVKMYCKSSKINVFVLYNTKRGKCLVTPVEMDGIRAISDIFYVAVTNLLPIPTKKPWELKDFLEQFAKWGAMEGVKVKGAREPEWLSVRGVESDRIKVTAIHYLIFSNITHLQGPNGEEVECVK